jgi:hypothetical protein
MKKVEANRYPHSATLFKFCKEALSIRYQGNVKVIDQDVGAILGYDPADCSHWKKGKKNIKALGTLKSIADHLNIDERLLIDIASGKINIDEAVFEYNGYGSFALRGKTLEGLKKEFFKNPDRWQKAEEPKSFEDLFDVNRPLVSEVVESVLAQGDFVEAPIYAPELLQLFPKLKLEVSETTEQSFSVTNQEDFTVIVIKAGEMRPYIRFLIAREIFFYLVNNRVGKAAMFAESATEVKEIQANIFAGMLLVPAKMLKNEVNAIDSSLDLVAQLANTFWVSTSLMNQRLRDYLENGC